MKESRGKKTWKELLIFALGNFITSRTDIATSSFPASQASLFYPELVVL
jgi:hypothetical protein